ncbi:MAG: methyltransferase domain-containing protein [Candidatus Rokuibacteriota bacterium]
MVGLLVKPFPHPRVAGHVTGPAGQVWILHFRFLQQGLPLMEIGAKGLRIGEDRSGVTATEGTPATPPPRARDRAPQCRHCGTPLRHTFVDLGMSPLCESYLSADQLNEMEPFYPLHAHVCDVCYLVQVEEYVGPARIFSDYAYFSSYSDSWLRHARTYVAGAIERFGLDGHRLVVELGSNDGYLLQYFVARGIPVLGIEPAANVARAATDRGVPTLVRLFDEDVARELTAAGRRPQLLIGNNVLAQVSDLNGFVRAMKLLLHRRGVITLEVPHLMRLVADNQFDTIYHEHFSYFSFLTAERVFAAHGLTIFDVEELPTHGGSLRLYVRHTEDLSRPITGGVVELRARETAAGLTDLAYYASFGERVQDTKRRLLDFLISAKRQGRSIAGYGAPGKGNALLNYCGIRRDFLDYTVDRSPHKQGRFLPGTHIPILHPDALKATRPDYVLILPWNLTAEIVEQMAHVRDWGGRFVVPIPEVRVLA